MRISCCWSIDLLQACQKEAWKTHKRVCKPAPVDLLSASPPREPIAGVRVLGGNNRPFYPERTTVGSDHPVWTLGSISPVSQVVDVPILIHREREETDLAAPNDADLDNQSVTYLMIEPVRGFAPPRCVLRILICSFFDAYGCNPQVAKEYRTRTPIADIFHYRILTKQFV